MNDIDAVRVHFQPGQLHFLNICLAYLMFGVALDVRLSQFREVFRNPKAPVTGLICQYLLFPTLTLGLIYLLHPPTSVALGMALVSACPSGNVANYATHLAGANVALSVTLNSIITLMASISTPLVFGILSRFIPGAAAFQQEIYVNPLDMVVIIVELIAIPLVSGILMNYFYPVFVNRIKRVVKISSMVIFIGFIIAALIGNYDNLVHHLGKVFWLVMLLNGSGLLLGFWVARSARLSRDDQRTLSIESGIHNTGLGLILIFNFFNGIGGMAMIAAWYGVWDLITIFLLASWWSRTKVMINDEI